MAVNKLKAKIEELELGLSDAKAQNLALLAQIEREKVANELSHQQKEADWQERDRIKSEAHKAEVDGLNSQVSNLGNQLKDKQSQLDRKELKKLAQAFSDQEEINSSVQGKWLAALIVTAILLIIYAIWSIILTKNMPWIDRVSYYIIDLIFISSVWFCASQFSEATKRRHDYGNRKTLAQSFHNILNNLAEDESIRTKFIEKATDVLCAPVRSDGKDPVLTKRVIRDVSEIIGLAVKR